MTNETLALYSNYSIYSAIVVLTLAMLAFAVDLAGTTTRRKQATAPVEEKVLVAAGAGGPGEPTGPDTAERSAVGATGGPGAGASGAAAPVKRQWAGMGMSLTWLALLLMMACVALRGLSVDRPPLGNMYEFANVGATFVLLAFCLYSLRSDARWLGLFVTAPALLTLGLSVAVFYTQASQLLPSLRSFWLVIHVTVATLSVALFTIAFSVTILYLVQAWLEKLATGSGDVAGAVRGNTLSGLKASVHELLPSSRQLDRTAYGLHIVAFPLWTFTLIAGAIWAEQAWGTYWGWDPKEVWTFVIWIVYAAYLHARATSGWNERKAAYIALAGFACILINYMVVNVYFVGMHSYSGM
ncbi:MAG TPA: c-type cytochrome biogenesis protein CcsB [Segeticoccus sp.]|uniref:c-type cytochrome biogenesis protein CcsB n=1 Tax=Segeticoccus sp. TaxID=2706531 RepID=UPI002D7F32A9|nr:c-type cytochrome biogenesis protein CcsB [Segeticoccus sp.]HET8601073.1 c-type cytochrome biogenesis protein CcsB [Segeticoccus sp.]